MIDKGFYINIKDEQKLAEFKNTHVYSEYLKSIHSSPAFSTLIREHIQNVDIKSELNILKSEGKLPGKLNSNALSEVFKNTLTYLAMRIMADSIILKELEDKKIDDVINDMTKDQTVTYMLGLADPVYYERAEEHIERGEIDKNSATYRGLVNYMKIQGKSQEKIKGLSKLKVKKNKEVPEKMITITNDDLELDMDDDDIRL